MNEHQIEGSKLLAEVEGYGTEIRDGELLIDHYGIDQDIDYLNDWNDLMRVAHKIEKHGFIIEISLCLGKTCQIFKPGTRFTYESNDAKLSVFMCLVEAAEWIKQQEK
jgi:hypothetical protein